MYVWNVIVLWLRRKITMRQVRHALKKRPVEVIGKRGRYVLDPDFRTRPTRPPIERRTRQRAHVRKGTRILIIDDSPTILAALKKMLESVGYVALQALDAKTGLDIAQSGPSLIFLDILLPDMNGFAALRLMRRDPVTHRIPVILMTGNELAAEQFYAQQIGADDFMKKPFSRAEVFARIEHVLDSARVPHRDSASASASHAAPAKH
jgi:twitching motility two-component system response regulator PilH